MKPHLLTIAALAGLALPAPIPAAPAAPARFALVELFTSEGCSSCPPADQLLAKIAADAAHAGEPIATLSFHVTYWNHLGWTDRFSSEAFTRRQTAYARRLELPSLYTPQMVVDGEQQFVGSNAGEALSAIRAALARTRATEITLDAHPDSSGVSATCRVSGAPDGAVLWIAWADTKDASAPDAGENEGVHLVHANVVRALEQVPLRGGAYNGTVHLRRPENVPGAVVAWVQRGDVGAVLGGAIAAVTGPAQ